MRFIRTLPPIFAGLLLWTHTTTLPSASRLLAAGPASPPSTLVDPEEKKKLDHDDYDLWNSVRSQNISDDGQWISFSISPGDGDSTLKIRHTQSNREYSILRGSSARFTDDSQHILYTVSPDPDVIEKLRKAKTPSSDLPKQHLEIVHLESGKRETIEKVSRFTLAGDNPNWVVFEIYEDDASALSAKDAAPELTVNYEITSEGIRRPEKEKEFRKPEEQGSKTASKAPAENSEKPSKKSDEKETVAKKKDDKPGSTLVLRHLVTQVEYRFPFVDSYRFNEPGTHLAFATSSPDGKLDGVSIFDLNTLASKQIVDGVGHYGQVVFSEDGEQLAFLTDRDDYAADNPTFAVYHWKLGQKAAQAVVAADDKSIPKGWIISSSSAPQFTEDTSRLLYQTRPKPEEDADKEDDEPVAKLDLWHWQDPFLQPQQLLRASAERNRSYLAIFDIKAGKAYQIETPEIPSVSLDTRSPADVALGVAPDQYEKMLSWDTQGFADWYLVNLNTGKPRLLTKMKRGRPSLSPNGRYIIWWDGEAKTWFALSTNPRKAGEGLENPINLGSGIPHPIHDELHDTPSLPGSYGSAGWTDDDNSILVYDRWDIWEVDPREPEDAVCITLGKGREELIEFRGVRLDSELRFVDLAEHQILSAFEHKTKASGYYKWEPSAGDDAASLEPLIMLNESVGGLRKAKDADAVMFTRSTFQRYPDLWSSTLEFETTRRISKANPQQDNYLWGSAELTRWKATDGQELDGILYKPENFDPAKKYPLMVYFYERNSDNLHRYYAPEAGRSIINFSFYVSRGYCIFVPDIPYKTGEPGPSAANAILPGVEHIVEQGFIDPERIGMQGHSWGGYQTAYLVTVTDMFACAESGAPVSNMTSAYGGIRWGSGMSRMFQYEKTQSRIGGTLWDSREKYIANSPVFFADKVNTPLLILHNDEDTAVPWYQGIEMFVALRRLEKPAWMLNYNGEPHWVMKKENRLDFAKRMQQFFDHYLLGDPMPVWMAEGIPAVNKGKEFGFEYLPPTEESNAEESKSAEEATQP